MSDRRASKLLRALDCLFYGGGAFLSLAFILSIVLGVK